MNTIAVDSWLPLICPQRQFRDKEGSPNAYVDTNPSLFVDSEGNTTILIRQVNYRKFKDRSFIMGEGHSVSQYHILRGNYKNGKFNLDWEASADTHTPMQKYPTYWYGPEDIRFVDEHIILAIYPELSPGGNPRMVLGNLDTNKTMTFRSLLEGSDVEKNWMPFTYQDTQLAVYSVSPLTIKPLNSFELTTLHLAPELAGYHGSTNGIPFKGGFLFLIHKYTNKTEHRWLYLNMREKQVSFSEAFVFFRHSYIEFPCSLVELPDGKLAISMGINDDKAMIAILDKSAVQLCEAFSFTS
jgi:hypothetical protein